MFTNTFYGKDGVSLALLGRLMTNMRYAFRAWYVDTRACMRDNYLFKINNCSHQCFLLIKFAAKGHNVMMHKLKHKQCRQYFAAAAVTSEYSKGKFFYTM